MTMIFPNGATFGSWSVVAAVVLGILLLKVITRHKNLPPGPRGFPIIGALHLLGKHPSEDLAKLAKTYGPVMSLWFGQQLTVVASSPAAAEEILKTQGPNFSGRLKTSFAGIVLPDDITMHSDSPARLHLKKILHMQLSTARQLQKSASLRAQEIAHILDVIPQDGTTMVAVRSYIDVVVTNILSHMVLKKRFMAVAGKGDEGLAELEQVRDFRVILHAIADNALRIDPGDYIPIFKLIDIQGYRRRLWNLRKQMDAFMSKIISEHLAQRTSGSLYEKDMVDMLLDQVEDETLRFNVTNQNVHGTLWDAFTAGTDTTIDAVEWAIAECIHNPNVMSKAHAELDAVVGKSRRVEDADIPNLKYLQAIIKEVFRLHPVAPLLFPHVSENNCKVFGYDIPVGTSALVNVGAIARDPSIWEDPLVFKPERFLEGMPHASTDAQGLHFELLPFGTGRRQCPGIALGTAMMHILTAAFLHSFDWSLPNNLQPVDLDMTEAVGLLSVRAQPLTAVLKGCLSISPIVN